MGATGLGGAVERCLTGLRHGTLRYDWDGLVAMASAMQVLTPG